MMDFDADLAYTRRELDGDSRLRHVFKEAYITDIVYLLRIINDVHEIRCFRDRTRRIAEDICPRLVGICRCNFCKKDFEGLYRKHPRLVGYHPETVCPTCSKYKMYLDTFPKEQRHELLRNRRCEKCRVNKVQSKIMTRRVCPSCFEYRKKKGKNKSRAFFQAMAMQEAVSNNS